jgi:hypothetical protein
MSGSQWFVRTKSGASGPYTPQQLKDFATKGKLPRQANISKQQDGPWTVAEKVRGLFPEEVLAEALAAEVLGEVADRTEAPHEEIRASDFIPDVVKKSSMSITSAVTNISKSIIAQVKEIETGLATRAESATATVNSLCADGQDPSFIEKMSGRLKELCTKTEQILYIAVQSKPIANFAPDSVVLTDRRFIIFRPKLLGRMSFVDCLWRDCKDVHVEENMIGATLALTGMNGHVEKLDYIPKAQARMIYRVAQEQEEVAFHTRRNMHMEELQASADKTVINQAIGTIPQHTSATIDPVAKLTQLKQLLDSGIIDKSEFDTKKAELLKLI